MANFQEFLEKNTIFNEHPVCCSYILCQNTNASNDIGKKVVCDQVTEKFYMKTPFFKVYVTLRLITTLNDLFYHNHQFFYFFSGM